MASYDTRKVKTSPPYEQYYEPLGATTVFSRKVCLYKLTKQADATLTFDMCTSNKCEWRKGGRGKRVPRGGGECVSPPLPCASFNPLRPWPRISKASCSNSGGGCS
jgi:hypothetical protein